MVSKWYYRLNLQITLQQEIGVKTPIKITCDNNMKCAFSVPHSHQADACIDNHRIDLAMQVFNYRENCTKKIHSGDTHF